MPNYILKTLIKNPLERTIYEILDLMTYWEKCSEQELKYALMIDDLVKEAEEENICSYCNQDECICDNEYQEAMENEL